MTYQLPLSLPGDQPAIDLSDFLADLDTLPMTCPRCGTERVVMISSVTYGDDPLETWLCFVCNQEFDGWDEIPHPQWLRQ